MDTLLTDLFSSSKWAVRVTAIRALEMLGKQMPKMIIQALTDALAEDRSKDVRAAAAEALGQLEERAPRASLILALGDLEWNVRASVIQALGKLGQKVPVQTLLTALQDDEEPSVRAAAASALGRLKQPELLDPLIRALQDHDFFVRLAVVQALGKQDEHFPTKVLITTLKDKDEDVRLEALKALGERVEQVPIRELVVALEDEDEDIRITALKLLKEHKKQIPLEPLLFRLKDQSEHVRTEAEKLLGRLSDQIPKQLSSEFLLPLLQDETAHLRAVAAWALGEQKNESAKTSLLIALNDPNELVRAAVTWALQELNGQLIGTSQAEAVRERWHTPIASKSNRTRELFNKQTTMIRFLSALTEYLEDKKGYVHPELWETPTERVLILFCYCQNKGSSLGETVLSVVASRVPVKLKRLDEALDSGDKMVQAIAKQALERLRERSGKELFITSLNLLQDAEVQAQMKVPTRIVLCSISLHQVRSNDIPVLGQILTTFEKESICAYSAKIGIQTQWTSGEQHSSPQRSLPKTESFLQQKKPNTTQLGRALSDFQVWYGSPSEEISNLGPLNNQIVQNIY
jgi:HEAT repeat protein